jgi:undecaprenyl-diphosphatase
MRQRVRVVRAFSACTPFALTAHMRVALPCVLMVLLASPLALAADAPAKADDESAPATAPERKTSLEPKPAEKPADKERFAVDPYSDGAVLIISGAFTGLSQMIISSGELKPQQPVDKDKLSWIDKGAVTQSFDPNASSYSNYGMFFAFAYAVADPILSGVRENNVQTFMVDAMMYAESALVTAAMTNLSKLAIRRPRPRAYLEQEKLAEQYPDPATRPDITETDTALSFVSGHSSVVAALSATATHLAFARAPKGSARPWITMVGGILLTSFVAYERVRSGAHFPTDVIAGALIGASVGVLVPHMHDDEKLTQKHVWIGYQNMKGGGLATAMIAF